MKHQTTQAYKDLVKPDYWYYTFEVVRVHDGDTIYGDIHIDAGLQIYMTLAEWGVRFAKVDAAELGTKEGDAALEALSKYVTPGMTLELMSMEWDKYGRRIDGDVFLPDGTDVIEKGLEEGWLRPWTGEGEKPW